MLFVEQLVQDYRETKDIALRVVHRLEGVSMEDLRGHCARSSALNAPNLQALKLLSKAKITDFHQILIPNE